MSPNRLYAEAKDEMGASQWDKAVPLLEKLEARAAGTPLAQQAQLDKAYAQFKAGEQAVSRTEKPSKRAQRRTSAQVMGRLSGRITRRHAGSHDGMIAE